MSTWKIHEVATACGLTEYEIGGWISKGIFQPGATTRRGRHRRYDWRDLACLAVFRELRAFGLPLGVIRLVADALREDLARIEEFGPQTSVRLFGVCWRGDQTHGRTVGPLDQAGLADLLCREPRSFIVVDVAKVYQETLTRISGLERAA